MVSAPPAASTLGPDVSSTPSSDYSLGEEIAHGLTHGVGIVLAIVGLCVLVTFSALYGSAIHVVASSIFGASMIVLYTASTLYHSLPMPETKRIMRVVDHAAIYLLIAGTYTPFTLVTLQGVWGWSLFGVVWSLAVVGIVFKLFFTGRFDRLSVGIYIAMGWCGVVAIKPMMAVMPTTGLLLLLAGGLAYTGGVAFYLLERMRYNHAVWHLFVMAGTALHYFTILFFVVPRPG